MHEMSLCEGVLRILEKQARAQRFHRVKTVWLEIGELAGVEKEAVRFSFDVVMKGSLADGARLEIIETPGEAWCMQCMKPVRINRHFDACSDCGGHQLQLTGGTEMRVKELEVD